MKILNAFNSGQENLATPVHVTSTIATSIEISSTGAVGAVSVDADGNIYNANFDTSVWRTRPDGSTVLLNDEFTQASGNFVLDNGDILQADYKENAIYRINADGTRRPFSRAGLDGPVGIAQLSSGDFIVANHRGKYLARIPATGGDAEFYFRDERVSQPNGVVIDNLDRVFIADLGRGDVFRLSQEGDLSVLTTLPGRGNAHYAIANGALYVSKIWDHVIYRVELDDGAYAIVSGNGRAGYDDGGIGESTIEEPNGIAATAERDLIYFNTHRGTMGVDFPGVIVLRKLEMLPSH